jgi:hypothetical protein
LWEIEECAENDKKGLFCGDGDYEKDDSNDAWDQLRPPKHLAPNANIIATIHFSYYKFALVVL